MPPFEGRLAARGRSVELERTRDEFWATFDDPDWHGAGAGPSRIRRQIVLVTGSHHQQVFWYATGRKRLLGQLPLTYLVGERQWIPRRAAFMHPPIERPVSETGHWNAVCVGCHATNGRPRFDKPPGVEPLDRADADTQVSELGIACEACHGPAAEHVRANQNPLRRYRLHLTGAADATIVQPERLDARAGSEVCGQCHSVWELPDAESERRENDGGVPYTPGGDLRKWRFIAEPARHGEAPRLRELVRDDPGFVSESFWSDGMVSVSGREYNGLIESPCYRRGHTQKDTMRCLSCHTMHKPADDARLTAAWADDQLKAGMDGNQACLQCHGAYRADAALAAHTHHDARSSGSECYNCHMPYTTYGLLKAIRSHQVSSPTVQSTLETGRPNACNLCHLDKSLGWTSQQLKTWYGTSLPAMSDDERSIAASVLWMLSGDAQQRGLVAYGAGWNAAQRASGTAWMVPILTTLLDDPYEAVRFIAERSLRTLPHGDRALAGSVNLDAATIDRLRQARNDRRVFLRE